MIKETITGQVLLITIDRPDKRNAVNEVVATGIEAAIDHLEAEDDLRVGVLTGAGDVFCAGGDLVLLGAGRFDELATDRGGFAGLVRRRRVKPLIAAVDGPALAGGFELALACDLVVASTRASFGIPEVKRGLLASGGGVTRLPRRVPYNVALELGLTGSPLSAQRAYELGLINSVCAAGDAGTVALDLARTICANAPLAVAETRRLMHQVADSDDLALMDDALDALARLAKSADAREGPRAFLEKRQPRWTGT
jgi:enoyl-CoA hydratase